MYGSMWAAQRVRHVCRRSYMVNGATFAGAHPRGCGFFSVDFSMCPLLVSAGNTHSLLARPRPMSNSAAVRLLSGRTRRVLEVLPQVTCTAPSRMCSQRRRQHSSGRIPVSISGVVTWRRRYGSSGSSGCPPRNRVPMPLNARWYAARISSPVCSAAARCPDSSAGVTTRRGAASQIAGWRVVVPTRRCVCQYGAPRRWPCPCGSSSFCLLWQRFRQRLERWPFFASLGARGPFCGRLGQPPVDGFAGFDRSLRPTSRKIAGA